MAQLLAELAQFVAEAADNPGHIMVLTHRFYYMNDDGAVMVHMNESVNFDLMNEAEINEYIQNVFAQ